MVSDYSCCSSPSPHLLLRDRRGGAGFLYQRQRVVILLCVVETKQLLIRELCGEPLPTAVVSGKQGRVDFVTVCYRLYELNESGLFRWCFGSDIPGDGAAGESARWLSVGVRQY